MKKIVTLSFAVLVIVFLAGCGQKPVNQTLPTAPVQQPTQPATNQNSAPANIQVPEKQEVNIPACDVNTKCGTTCLYNGDSYPTKMLAGSCWVTKNINTIMKADGITSSNRYCYNDDPSICSTDGGLYTWADAYGLPLSCNTATCTVKKNQQGICPNGWHVVAESEWATLTKAYSFDELITGGSSGFNAMLVGYRNAYNNGIYDYRGLSGHHWSSTNFDTLQVWYRSFYSDSEEKTIYRSKNPKTGGAAVRCIKN